MFKVSRKEKLEKRKRTESFSKEKKSLTTKQHSMHAFMFSTTVSYNYFNKAYLSIEMFIDVFELYIAMYV